MVTRGAEGRLAERSRRGYAFRDIEERWRRFWEEERLHRPDLDRAERPFYNLMMFPYPSAEGLHVGNCFAFIGADIYGRAMRMRGYDVFEPIGFDAFGIHSENYALKVGKHPSVLVPENIARFTEQLRRLGNQFDWAHVVDTTIPEYYRWTQWLFVTLMRAGLVERKRAPVNWCPSCKTVLADEQVEAGLCERCGMTAISRELTQWFFKITAYQERLLANLEWIDWSEITKRAQERWIGRSEGTEVVWLLDGSDRSLTTFTTRVDTIFGVTFLVIAPEHPALAEIASPAEAARVAEYAAAARLRARAERHDAPEREKSGVPTGASAIHPLTGERVPIWTADYVLMGYGTGVVQGVPAHDARDLEFARRFALPVREVVRAPGTAEAAPDPDAAFEGEGALVDSGAFSGLTTENARREITAALAQRGLGRAAVLFRLHDWCVSRQRYWGPPIPVIHCPRCGALPVPDDALPVLLPMTNDYIPDDSGKSPLAKIDAFVRTTCPRCGDTARRDTDVLDNFLDSAWYYLRYPCTEFHDRAFDPERVGRWLPVDMYIGGQEHAVLHLLYTRFLSLALHDLGLLPFDEPFKRFRAHGLIIKNGAKMSKSRGNVVNPDEYLDLVGTDAFRLYLMFLGPFTEGGDFRDEGMVGVERFLDRVHALRHIPEGALSPAAESKLHWAIKKVTDDIESLKYNTGIAAMMETLNLLEKEAPLPAEALGRFVRILAPFAPHLAEEIWHRIGGGGSIFRAPWPEYDPARLVADTIEIVFQVNGKVRGKGLVPRSATEEDLTAAALADPQVQAHASGRPLRRVVVVAGKLVNVVVG
jgi:leucyl-tRNA synthetase